MSATVMRYPREWAALVDPLRARVGPLADVKLGIGLNFNRLDDTSSTGQVGAVRGGFLITLPHLFCRDAGARDGCKALLHPRQRNQTNLTKSRRPPTLHHPPAQTFSSSRVSWLMWAAGATGGRGADRIHAYTPGPATHPPCPPLNPRRTLHDPTPRTRPDIATGRHVPPIDGPGIKSLIEQKLDFVGVSAYAPLSGPGMQRKEFENAAFMLGVRGAAARWAVRCAPP
jgi:hypothetical protein